MRTAAIDRRRFLRDAIAGLSTLAIVPRAMASTENLPFDMVPGNSSPIRRSGR